MKFETDSEEYHILQNAVRNIKNVPGAIVEIGTRKGGSAQLIIDTLVENDDTNRAMFCIDPYGDILFPLADQKLYFNYTNDMRNEVVPNLYKYAYDRGLNFQFFLMEDTEFFKRFTDGVPIYDNKQKMIVDKYAMVFLDGPHDNVSVLDEVYFFMKRSYQGSVIVIDDAYACSIDGMFNPLMETMGYVVAERGGSKVVYQKVFDKI